ncbi:MAG: flippase [Patescibacteria group bacterium]
MSTTRAIAHNTLVQLIGKIVSTGLGLLALGMLTRTLGQEKFGWYITAITFLQFAGILIDFGLIPVTAQMLGEGKIEEKKLLKNLLGFRFATALIFFAVLPIIALFFPYPREVKIAIGLLTISFLAIAMNQVFTGFYQKRLKMHVQVIGENISRIVLVVGLWFLIREGSSFLPLMGMIAISSVVYVAFLWISAAKDAPVGFAFDSYVWREIIKKMWPIAVSIIFNVIYLKGDILILSIYRTQSEVGLYGAPYRVIDIIAQTALMLMGVMLPILSDHWTKNLKEEFGRRYQQAFDSMMVMAIPLMVGTIILADKIMAMVAPEFNQSGAILRILAVAVFGLFLGAVFGHVAVAINRQKQTMWIYISDAIITLAGYLVFIPLYGFWGAAWMTVFSELYAGIMLWITIRRHSGQKLKFAVFNKIIIAGLFMGIILLLLNFLSLLLLIFIGASIYALALILLKGIKKETIREIFSSPKN